MKAKSFTNSHWTFTFGVFFNVQAQHASSQTLIYDNCTHYTAAQMEKSLVTNGTWIQWELCCSINCLRISISTWQHSPILPELSVGSLERNTSRLANWKSNVHCLVTKSPELTQPGHQVTWPYTISLSSVIILRLVCICSELYFWPEIVWKF
jgi:hypothetical protein